MSLKECALIGSLMTVGCAGIQPYKVPDDQPRAKLTASTDLKGFGSGSIWMQAFDSLSCAGNRFGTGLTYFSTLTSKSPDPVEIDIFAGEAFVYSFHHEVNVPPRRYTCGVTQSFKPVAGEHYHVRFHAGDGVCNAVLTRIQAGQTGRKLEEPIAVTKASSGHCFSLH